MTGIETTAAIIAATAAVAGTGVAAYTAAQPVPKPPKPAEPPPAPPPMTMPDPEDPLTKRRAQQRAVTEAQGGRLSTIMSQDSGSSSTLGG